MMGTTSLALADPGLGFASPGNPLTLQSILSGETKPAMAPPSDRALAEQAVRGDTEAFAELYRRYERPIFNFILRSVGQRALAEELLQETFTRVWRVGRTFDPVNGSFRPWLYKIALNTLRSELRKKRYAAEHVPLDELEGQGRAPRPTREAPEGLDLAARAPGVARALDRLAPYLRDIVILRCYQQLTFAEIAEATSVPEGTLKVRFHRAVLALRAALQVGGRSA
jgi:RNA polymerase sigma-70 factor (ECF subfamily)